MRRSVRFALGFLVLAFVLAGCASAPQESLSESAPSAAQSLSHSRFVKKITSSKEEGKRDEVVLKNGTTWDDIGESLSFVGEVHSPVGDHAILFTGTACHHCVDGNNILVRSLVGGKIHRLPYPGGLYTVVGKKPGKRKETRRYWLYYGRCESPSEDVVLSYRVKHDQPHQTMREVLRFGVSGLIEMRKVAKYEDVMNFKPPRGCITVPPEDREGTE